MQHSRDRILTTHTGSLPRPAHLAELIARRETGPLSAEQLQQLPHLMREAARDAVSNQVKAGIDVVSDGEVAKIGYSTYVKERLSGFQDGQPSAALAIADLDDYPGFAARALAGLVTAMPACTGSATYVGAEALATDLENFRAALAAGGVEDAFVPAASPGVISVFLENRFYSSEEEYLIALADAMHHEYRAIVDAKFVLQIDAPDLAMGWHIQYPDSSLEEFRKHLRTKIEVLNHALHDIPPDSVRLHLCWGNYEGPHHHDIALQDILDVVLHARVGAISFEAANPRHAHEWRVFEDARLPDDKIIIPGVIDTSTNYVEHPELVAERVQRYARLVGRERVMAGTDCGFATFATFLPIDPRIAWAKLATLAEGARLASQQLW